MKRRLQLTIISVMMLVVMACTLSLDGGLSEAEQLETAVAQALTASVDDGEDNQQPLPTITLAPTATKPGDPTVTPKPCNDADFVSETIPDGTEFDTNENFAKTWRVLNAGTCTWNTNYKIVFVSGDKMSGPASVNLPNSVAPGEQIDLILNLKAPGSAGEHEGFWNLADPNGAHLLNYLSVNIKAVAPAAPPLPPAVAALTLNYVKGEGGSIRTGGDVHSGLHNVGDTSDDKGSQLFASFDMSGIPAGSTITEVIIDFDNYDKLGDPWGSLNCLRLYKQDYGALNAADYYVGVPMGALIRWCNDGELSANQAYPDLIAAVQSKVGSNRFQVRLQFKDLEHDGDGTADMVRFIDMKLHVTYELP